MNKKTFEFLVLKFLQKVFKAQVVFNGKFLNTRSISY